MDKATFETFHKLTVELKDGGLLLTQDDQWGGQEQSIFIPGRYVAEVLKDMERVARGAE